MTGLPAPKTPAALLVSELAHPVALDLLLHKRYGRDWYGWEIEVVEAHLRQDYQVKDVPDLTMEKLQACRTLHMVDSFWLQWEVFLPCSMAFNGHFPDFRLMQAPTTAEIMVTVDCANRIRTDVPWSDEIKRYLQVVCRFDDVLVLPAPLEFIPVEEYVDLMINIPEVRRRWPAVRSSGQAPTDGTIEGEQLRRMLAAHQYLEVSRTLLEQQLVLLK